MLLQFLRHIQQQIDQSGLFCRKMVLNNIFSLTMTIFRDAGHFLHCTVQAMTRCSGQYKIASGGTLDLTHPSRALSISSGSALIVISVMNPSAQSVPLFINTPRLSPYPSIDPSDLASEFEQVGLLPKRAAVHSSIPASGLGMDKIRK